MKTWRPDSLRRSCCGQCEALALQVLHRFEHPDVLCIGHQRCTPAVAPDDALIAVGTSSGLVLLLDMKTGDIHSKLVSHVDAVACAAWAPRSEDDAAVAATVDRMGNIVFWQQNQKDAVA